MTNGGADGHTVVVSNGGKSINANSVTEADDGDDGYGALINSVMRANARDWCSHSTLFI